MSVYAITTNYFGEPRLFGVYESAAAAGVAYEHLAEQCDVGDEFRIRKVSVESYSEVKDSLDRCRAQRAIEDAVGVADESD